MFTGIIVSLGKVKSVKREGRGKRVFIENELSEKLKVGESVAVDGVCLTVDERTRDGFFVYLSDETLRVSKFGKVLRPGYRVNLEPPLSLETPIGGHLVTGHIDCLGRILKIVPKEGAATWATEILDPSFRKYVIYKGSVALDGVSLTVSRVTPRGFEVELIPYTLSHTNFLDRKVGEFVNLEFDLLGKYVEHFLKER